MVDNYTDRLVEMVQDRITEWEKAPYDEKEYAIYAKHTHLLMDLKDLLDVVRSQQKELHELLEFNQKED